MPIWYSSVITPDGDFYIIGGGDPNYDNYDCPKVDTIYKFNEELSKMECVAKLSSPRDVSGSSYSNGFIYICGGRDNKIEYVKTTDKLNVKTNEVTKLSDCVTPSGQPAVVTLNDNYIFKIGGW